MRLSKPKILTAVFSTKVAATVCLLALILTSLVGCTPAAPNMVTVVDPTELALLEFKGQWVTTDKSKCVSPSGKYLLAAIQGTATETMSAIPLPARSEGENITPVTSLGESINFYSVDTSWTKNNLVQWLPVGWLSEEKCVFVVHGWFDQGEHQGERGTCVMIGDLAQNLTSPIAFIESPVQGKTVDDLVLSDAGKLILRISNDIWTVDVESGEKTLLRDDFPDYGTLFYLAISPKGDYAVYNLNQDDKLGVFIMDLATGEEKPLLPAGDTLSFYPTWSPDGKYVAAYTANALPDASGQGLQLYKLLPGEDGPMPAAQNITIADTQGNVVKTIALGPKDDGTDQFLFQNIWLADSKNIAFVSADVVLGKWGEVKTLEYAKSWIADVESSDDPVMCADLIDMQEGESQSISYIFSSLSLPEGHGMLLSLGYPDNASVWQISKEGSPRKLTDGWWQTPRFQPYFQDGVIGAVRTDDGALGVWWASAQDSLRFGESEMNEVSIVAHTDEILITMAHDYMSNDTVITIYDMLKQVEQDVSGS